VRVRIGFLLRIVLYARRRYARKAEESGGRIVEERRGKKGGRRVEERRKQAYSSCVSITL
jgi:hypothetical protein